MRVTLVLALLFFMNNSIAQKDEEKYDEAVELYKAEEYKKALKSVKKAIKISPSNAEYYLLKADAHVKLGDYAEAYKAYSDAIFYEPEESRFYNSRGIFLSSVGDIRKSIKDYNKAINLAENDTLKMAYYTNRSTAKSNKRDFEGAYEDLMLAYQIDSMNVAVLSNLGAVCDEVGKGDETIMYLKRILTIDSLFIGAYVNLGFKYQGLEQYEISLAYFDKAVEIDPDEPLVYSNRSFTKLKLGDLEGALRDINKSIEMYPVNSYAYKNRALIYLELKDYKNLCLDLSLAIQYGFTKRYGNEVIELQEEYCR